MSKNPQSALAIEMWDIERPVEYPRNARKWSKRAIQVVADSIREYGFRQPIVVDAAGVIVIGHLRRTAARTLGMIQVPVHVARDLSPAKIRGLRLMDNRSAQESTFDLDALGAEFLELKALDFDLKLTGFDTREIDNFTLSVNPAEDDVPPVPEVPVTRIGDLWLLGDHRLLCGDSTKAEDVARLMDGQRAGLMNTDPPYGVGYANDERPHPGVAKPRVAKPRVANDALPSEGLQQFLTDAFIVAKYALSSASAWYVWNAYLSRGLNVAAAAAGVHLACEIVWVKQVLALGRGQYHWKHESAFFGWLESGKQPPDYSERNQTTVWEIASVSNAERKEFNHSTPKPVELFRRPILKHLQPGEIAYEPFAGSGPQFIAAELTERKCYGLEIEPAYCDVIVTRWQNLTSKQATLGDGDHKGATFEQVKLGRLQEWRDSLVEEAHATA